MAVVDPATRRKVLKVIVVSLLLDLVSSTEALLSGKRRLFVSFSRASLLTPKSIDIFHLYPAAVPPVAGVLSRSRGAFFDWRRTTDTTATTSRRAESI